MYSWLCATLLNIFILFIIQTLHYSDFFVRFVFVCPDNRGWTVFPIIYVKLPHSREVSFLISPQWCNAKRRSLLLDGSLFPCTSSETCSMKARNIMFSLTATDIGVFSRMITGNVFFKIEIKKVIFLHCCHGVTHALFWLGASYSKSGWSHYQINNYFSAARIHWILTSPLTG